MSVFLQSAGKQFVRSPGLWRDTLGTTVSLGRKSATAVWWWAGYRPLLVEDELNPFRFGGRPPSKYLRYEYQAEYSGGDGTRSLSILFVFDDVFGDLAAAESRAVSLSGFENYSLWLVNESVGFWPGGVSQGGVNNTPDACPWPVLDTFDGQIKLQVPRVNNAFDPDAFLGSIPVMVTSPTRAEGTFNGTGPDGPFTITVVLELSVGVTVPSAAARAEALLEEVPIEEDPQDIVGNLNYDWLDPEVTQETFRFVLDNEQISEALALGLTPTTWVQRAYNRFTEGAVMAAVGWELPQHISAYGVSGTMHGVPTSGYNSWDLPKQGDGIAATKSLLAAQWGLNCANRGPWSDPFDIRTAFDYEVVWPYHVSTGLQATPIIGRQNAPAGMLLFDPGTLRPFLNDAGFEVGDSWVGSKPPGSPEGCPG